MTQLTKQKTLSFRACPPRSRGTSRFHSASILLVLCCLLTTETAKAQGSARPAITGIGSVKVALSDPSGAIGFYIRGLGFGGGLTICNGAGRLCLGVNGQQRIELL